METEPLAARAEVSGGTQRVAADENTPFGPPERDLLPPAAPADPPEFERRDRLLRDDMVRDAEPARERGAVTVVTVQQLEHARRLAGDADSRLDSLGVDGVDQPDAFPDDERMRAALHELVDDPPEAAVELVARADLHSHEEELTATP